MFIRKNKINKQKITGSVRSSKYGLTPFLYEVVVGFLAFCFILQPNLLVLASVRNSDKEKTLQTSKSDGNERAEKSQVEEPLIKKTAAEKSSKVFKAGDGLSKIDAVNLKNRINEQIAVENSKRPENNNSAQTEITVKENEIGTYPESEKNESNIKSSFYKAFYSLLNFFTGSKNEESVKNENESAPLPPLDPVNVQSVAVVRHGFNLSGRVEGSVQQLLGEGTIFNSNAVMTQDLLVPGVPTVVKNGNPAYGGTIAGTGSATPTNYQIILNSNSQLRNVITRTDAVAMPTVAAPPASTATQSVVVNNSSQLPTNYSNIRDLTLNSNAGTASVPGGTYRNFTVNSGSGIKLGTVGATQPINYNFNTLTLNSNSTLQIVSPVIINLANGLTLNSAVSSTGLESWLKIKVASGGVTLNSNSSLYGSVTAPNGTVTINSNAKLVGNVICDRLTINSNGLLKVLPFESNPSVNLAITSPANNSTTTQSAITVTGTAQSAIGIANVFVNNQPAAYNASNSTWTISNVALNLGSNVINVRAVDTQGAEASAQLTVTRNQPAPDTTAPTVAITSPAGNTITQAEVITVSGTVSDSGANASGVASVTVNNAPAQRDVAAGTWSFANFGLNIGSNIITVRASDVAGNISTTSVTIVREPVTPPDTTAPTISIAAPENNAVVHTPEINVSGFAADQGANATGIRQVRVNGHPAVYNAGNRTWTISNVSLAEGENTIIAEAEDNAQPTPNISRSEVRIIRQNVLPPTVNITSPPNGTVTSSNTITIAGNASSNSPTIPVSVTVNGVNTVLSGSEFTKTVSLDNGSNTITAIAVDSLNQTSQTSITVFSDTIAPTVALQNVPSSVSPLQSYVIKAVANDDQSLATVEFLVNGESAAVRQSAPFEFTLQVPGNATPGNIYNISAVAKDAAGNSFADTVQTIIAGPSGVAGYVFDDKTGYAVEGATATLVNSSASVSTDESGAYSLVSNDSFGTVKLAKANYTSIYRVFTTNSGTGLNLFDARLTELDSQINQIGTDGGAAQGDAGRVQVQFSTGSFAEQTDIRVTSVSPQGLINLLPYGWSPIPGAVIDLRTFNSSIEPSQNFAVPARLNIAQTPNSLNNKVVVLVRYDEVRNVWKVVENGLTAGENGSLTANVNALGQYAFVVADIGETAPPPAVIEKELPTAAEVSDTVLNNAQVTANANPKSAIVSQTAKSTISVTANSQTKIPSGVSIEATFSETYRLLGEQNPLIIDRLPQDFVLFSYPAATTEQPKLVSASFFAKPTRADLTTAQLQFGNVKIGIHAGRGTVEGVLIGTNGGEVSTDEDARIRIEAGSLPQNTPVFMTSVDPDLVGVNLPAGYQIIGAVDLNLSGANLLQSAKLSIPVVSGDNSRVVVAKLITAGSVRGLKAVARAAVENDRLISILNGNGIPNGFNFSGIKSGGRYVFVRIPTPFGYAAGTVKNAANSPVGNARVAIDRTPFIDSTGADGRFTVLTGTENGGTNYLEATSLISDATGGTQIATPVQDAFAAADIQISTVPLGVFSITPANNAANVMVSSPITVTFNKPIAPTSLTGSTFKVSTAAGNPVVGNITLLAGNRTASFTPNSNLAYAANYRVKISTAVKDVYGNAMSGEFNSSFTTAQIIAAPNRLKPENIRIAYPDTQGVSTISIPAGSVPEGSVITVINNNSGSTVSTVAGTSDVILRIVAQVGDEILLIVRQPDGTVYEVKQAAYRRADGFITVGTNGGTVASEDGQILLQIPNGAIEGQANLKLSNSSESEITAPRVDAMSPTEMQFAAGTKIEISGNFTQKEELHLEMPAPAGLSEGQRVAIMSPTKTTENGVERDIWEVATSGKVENGRIKTTSPPFFGIGIVATLQGINVILSYVAFVPRHVKAVVGKITRKETIFIAGDPRQISLPLKGSIIKLLPGPGGQSVIQSKTNDRGEFGMIYPTQTDATQIYLFENEGTAVGMPLETYPYQATDPSWQNGLFGFETRYVNYEFPDPQGNPNNRPAIIKIEGRTVGSPIDQDPLKLTGKVLTGSSVELFVTTTPGVAVMNGSLNINGVNQPLLLNRDAESNEYKAIIPADTEGAYQVTIETYTTRNVASSRATAGFSFVALNNPNNCPSLDGNPSILNGWSPRNGAVNVDAGTKIHLNFSEPVKNLTTGQTVRLFEIGDEGEEIEVAGSLLSAGLPISSNSEICSVDFQPTNSLKGGKEHLIKVTTGVKDRNDNPLSSEFSSRFTTFKSLVLNNPNDLPTGAYKIASAGNFIATLELSGTYPPISRLKVYDTSEPQAPELIQEMFTSQVATAIDMAEFGEGHEIRAIDDQGREAVYKNIIAITTTSHPNQERPNNVWFYAILDDELPTPENTPVTRRSPVRLIGVVSLNSPNRSPDFPASVKILEKRAYVGSSTSGGFWTVDIEGAVQQLAVDGINGWFPAVLPPGSPQGSGYAADRVRQKLPQILKDVLWRTNGISAINQPVLGDNTPIVYPAPMITGQPFTKATAINVKPTQFDNRFSFLDVNLNETDDRVISQIPLNQESIAIDVKASSQVALIGQTLDLSVYLSPQRFWLFNVSSPFTPNQLSTINFADFGLPQTAISIELEDRYVYVLFSDRVAVFDIGNPASPQLSALITDIGSGLRRFAVKNGIIYTVGDTGIRVSSGRAFASVLVRGKSRNETEFCATPVLLDKSDNRMLQDAEVSFQVYGHDLPQTAKVKIIKEKIVGTERIVSVENGVPEIEVRGLQNIIYGKFIWNSSQPIDTDANYTVVVVLDEGQGGELISKPIPIPFSYLINNYENKIGITHTTGENSTNLKQLVGVTRILLGAKAEVSLKINDVGIRLADCSSGELLQNNIFPFGNSKLCLTRSSFQGGVIPNNGRYPFQLKAVYQDGESSYTQTEEGFVFINSSNPRVRMPGSSIVNNVELQTGNLALSSSDINIPNRGLSLNLTRSYNSQQAGVFSPFGYGWRHNYQILLSYDPETKVYTLTGGEGENRSFNESEMVGGRIPAVKPYHGFLYKNADDSFDFLTKGRTKYHYKTAITANLNEAVSVGYMGNLDYIEEPNGNRITLKYDSLGRLEKAVDSSDRVLEFVYEQTDSALIKSFTGETGAIACSKKNAWKLIQRRFLQATTGRAWRIIEIKGTGGLSLNYAYDDHGNLASVTRKGVDDISEAAQDSVWSYKYDETNGVNSSAEHLLESVQSPNKISTASHKTSYVYDLTKPDLPVKQIDFPEGITNKFGYFEQSPTRFMTSVLDGNGNPTQYVFESAADGSNQLAKTKISAPLVAESTIEWTATGQKLKETDAEGLVTEYGYDEQDNQSSIKVSGSTDGEISLTTIHYDQKFNKPDQKSVKRGNTILTTNYTIDQNNGNVKQITLPNGRTVKMEYNARGDMFAATDQFGNRTNITSFDAYGNPQTTQMIGADGQITQTAEKRFDSRSRLTSSFGTLEANVINTYDALDRVTNQQVADPAGIRDPLEIVTTYKPAGQIASIERRDNAGLSYKATNTYDQAERLKNITEIVSGTTGYTQSFDYDNNSNLVSQTDRRGVLTARTYNALNFVVKETVQDAETAEKTLMEVLEINRVGSVKRYKDLFGKEVYQLFDDAHRLKERSISDCLENGGACSESFAYDGVNNLIRQTDKNGKATILTYDELNRPQTITNPLGQKTRYTYTDSEHKTEIFDEIRGVTETTVADALSRPLSRKVKFGETEYKTLYEYDGLNVKITDPRNTVTEQKLSAFGDAGETKILPGTGQFDQQFLVQMRYSAFGAVKQTTDAMSRQTTFTIDGFNRVRAANYPDPAHLGGVSETWNYDGEGLLLSHTDKRGTEMQTGYDLLGRETKVRVNNGSLIDVLTIDYNDTLATEIRKDANNHSTTLEFDGLHRVKKVTNADGKFKTYVYDGENLRQESDFRAEPKNTKYDYDALNRLTKIFDRENKLTKIDHADGSVYTKTVTDRRGNVLLEKYDALGRLQEVTSGGLLMAKYEYDANNNRTAVLDGEQNRSEFVYNNLNRKVVAKKGGNGSSFLQTESFTYDAVGNLKVYADGRGGAVSQNFDELDHLTDRRDGENNKTTFKYDGEGLLSEMTEPCGNAGANCDAGTFTTNYSYNAFGSLTNVTDAAQKNWAFTYYADGKLLKETTDPLTRKTTYTYDALDRLKTVKQPLVPATVYNYDENSNVISITDPNNQTQVITPDALDRVDTHVYKGANGAELLKYKYNYDAEDNVYQIDENLNIGGAQAFTHKRTFDSRNRLETAVDKFGHKVAFGYDKADNIRSISDYKTESSPTATTTGYVYDKQNRLQTVNLPNQETVSYNWHADGLLERVNYASGMKREYSYDNADRVTAVKNTVNASETQEFVYGYDANSNRKTETKKLNGSISKTFSYKYDPLDRLSETKETTPAPATPLQPNQQITVNENSAIKAFEYDAVGNREKEHSQNETVPITRTADGQGTVAETRGSPQLSTRQTATAGFDALNRLISLTEADGTNDTLSYDNNGNLLETKRNNVTSQTYEYDPRNQLRRVIDGTNSEVARFDYDAERRRVEKKVNGAEPEHYVYAGDKIVSEYRGVTVFETLQAKYQFGADETVRGEFFNQNEGAKYYFSDALGSTTALAGQINGNYTATNSYSYDSWGKVSSGQQSNNSIGYTGQRLDSETGLMALGNGERYYSPTLARFIQQDSFTGSLTNGQSLNRFAYGYNNPFRYTDPSGNSNVFADGKKWTSNENVNSWINTIGSYLVEANTPSLDKLNQSLGLWNEWALGVGDVFKATGEGIGNFAGGLIYGDSKKTLQEAWTGIKKFGSDVWEVVSHPLDSANMLFDVAMNDPHLFMRGLGQASGEVVIAEATTKAASPVTKPLTAAIKSRAINTGARFVARIGETAVGQTATRIVTEATERVGTRLTSAVEKAGQFKASITERVGETWQKLKGADSVVRQIDNQIDTNVQTPAGLTPGDFGVRRISEIPEYHRIWNDSLKDLVNSPRTNKFKTYLENLQNRVPMDNKFLQDTFNLVRRKFKDNAEAAGHTIDGEIHHWNYQKANFPEQLVNPDNLTEPISRPLHERIHEATSIGDHPIVTARPMNPIHQLPINTHPLSH